MGEAGAPDLATVFEPATVCVLLWSGVYMWESIRSMPFNWLVVQGRKGCRWGAYTLYFPLWPLAALSFGFMIVRTLPAQWQPSSVLTLHYIGESANIVTRLLVYHILTIQVAALWSNWLLSYSLVGAMLAVWAVSIYCIARIRSEWGTHVMLRVFAVCCLCLSTLLFAAFVLGLVRAFRHNQLNPGGQGREHQVTVWSGLLAQSAHLMAPIWVAQVVDTVTTVSSKDCDTINAVSVTCYITIILAGSRIYQHIAAHALTCPMTRGGVPCMISTVVRRRKQNASDFSASTSGGNAFELTTFRSETGLGPP